MVNVFWGIVVNALTAVALGVLLLVGSLRGPLFKRGVYKLGFFVGAASLGVWMISSGLTISFGPSWLIPPAPVSLMDILPVAVLVESGVSGYLGFSSRMRYVSLALAAVAVLGVLAAAMIALLRWR